MGKSGFGRLPGFVLVGAIGFLVDAGILTALMTGADFGHYGARAISFTVAVTATWYINRRWVPLSRLYLTSAHRVGWCFRIPENETQAIGYRD